VSRRQTGQRNVHCQEVCGPATCTDDSSARITTSPQLSQFALYIKGLTPLEHVVKQITDNQ